MDWEKKSSTMNSMIYLFIQVPAYYLPTSRLKERNNEVIPTVP
jgi:hypothetical protein